MGRCDGGWQIYCIQAQMEGPLPPTTTGECVPSWQTVVCPHLSSIRSSMKTVGREMGKDARKRITQHLSCRWGYVAR